MPYDDASTDDEGFLPPLPAEVRQARWGMGDVAAGFGLWFASQIVLGVVVAIFLVREGTATSDVDELDLPLWALGLTMAGNYAAFIGWPAIVARWKGLGSLVRDFGLRFRWPDLGWGLLAGIACLVLSGVMNVIYTLISSGGEAPSNATFLEDQPKDALTFLSLFVLVAVLTPVAEEIFFRGLVLRSATKRWGTGLGIVVSSTLFGLPHALSSTELSAMAFFAFVTGLYGAVIAVVCVKCDWRLGPAIVAHVVINGTGVATLFFLT